MSVVIIPSIDLREGKVVRLKQGDYAKQLNYAVDPIETAKAYQMAGAKWLHLVDLDGAKEGKIAQIDLISRIIKATQLNIQVGGGVRSEGDIEKILLAGAQRVVVGTHAMEHWDWFKQAAHLPQFNNRLVLAIDARDGVIATRGWTEASGRIAVDVAREVSDWPIAALLYTDISKDGMMTGPNFIYTNKLAESGKVPVIASGGVGSMDHLRELKRYPSIWGVIVGRALYEGAIDIKEALKL